MIERLVGKLILLRDENEEAIRTQWASFTARFAAVQQLAQNLPPRDNYPYKASQLDQYG